MHFKKYQYISLNYVIHIVFSVSSSVSTDTDVQAEKKWEEDGSTIKGNNNNKISKYVKMILPTEIFGRKITLVHK